MGFIVLLWHASPHSLFTVSEPAVPEPHRTLSDRTVSEPPSVSGSERAGAASCPITHPTSLLEEKTVPRRQHHTQPVSNCYFYILG